MPTDNPYQEAIRIYLTTEIANVARLIEGLDKAKPEQRVRDLRKAISLTDLVSKTLKNMK